MTRRALWVVLIVGCSCGAFGQGAAAASQPYDVKEAYQVYSVLLPHEEAPESAKNTLVIRQDTVSKQLESGCLTGDAARQYREAIADYERVNSKPWVLQRQFETEKPYELVSSETIKLYFAERGEGWNGFYKRYPQSGGYVVFSAVGFSQDKTKAVVYSGSACGALCGSWSFHLLHKVEGKWKEADGVTCFTVS